MLACLGSFNLQTAEVFFELHNQTSQLNFEGKVPKALKLLLVKMLAIDPNLRPRLYDIILSDDWVRFGPDGSMMSVLDYASTMNEIYQRVNWYQSGSDNRNNVTLDSMDEQ